MSRIKIIFIVASAVGLFLSVPDWPSQGKRILDAAESFVRENVANPFLFWISLAFLFGGGLAPSALRWMGRLFFAKKQLVQFHSDFDSSAEARGLLRQYAGGRYGRTRQDNWPHGVTSFLQTVTIPAALPLEDRASLDEWVHTTLPHLTRDQSNALVFAHQVLDMGNEIQQQRQIASKFWDKWGRAIRQKLLSIDDVKAELKSNQLDLRLLTYLEIANARDSGWDLGPGKSGLFYLAKETEKL